MDVFPNSFLRSSYVPISDSLKKGGILKKFFDIFLNWELQKKIFQFLFRLFFLSSLIPPSFAPTALDFLILILHAASGAVLMKDNFFFVSAGKWAQKSFCGGREVEHATNPRFFEMLLWRNERLKRKQRGCTSRPEE